MQFFWLIWRQNQRFNEYLVAKFVEEQGGGFVGRCPLHYEPLSQILHQKLGAKGAANQVK